VLAGASQPSDATAALLLDHEIAALTSDADELRSFEAVAATVCALHAQSRGVGQPEASSLPPDILRCARCGGPVAPTTAPAAACSYCRAQMSIPATVHEQLRLLDGLEASRAASERLLRRLLAQPGARATTALFAGAVPPLLLGWPVAGVLFDEFYQARRGVLQWQHGITLFVGAMCFTYGLAWLVRAQVAGRVALRLVATRFAAVPPRAANGPASCRNCGGPLPVASPEQLVSVCLYCRSENVLSVQLALGARREAGRASDLRRELERRLATRRRYRWISLGSVVLLAASVAVVAPAWKRMHDSVGHVGRAR